MKHFVFVLCVVLFIVSIPFICDEFLHMDSTYGGTEIFRTEQEYVEFKTDLKDRVDNDGIRLREFSALASEPPIVVKYSFRVPYGYDFPYGEVNMSSVERVMLTVSVVLVAGVLLVLFPCTVIYGSGRP